MGRIVASQRYDPLLLFRKICSLVDFNKSRIAIFLSGQATLGMRSSLLRRGRAAPRGWLRPKQTDLVPGKGQFRKRFPHPPSYCCPTTILLDPRNRHRHHLSATLLDGRAENGWARLLRCGRDRSGGGFPNAGYEPHPSCGDCPLTARSRPKERPKYPEKSQMSGAVTDRPALHDALEFAQRRHADRVGARQAGAIDETVDGDH